MSPHIAYVAVIVGPNVGRRWMIVVVLGMGMGVVQVTGALRVGEGREPVDRFDAEPPRRRSQGV